MEDPEHNKLHLLNSAVKLTSFLLNSVPHVPERTLHMKQKQRLFIVFELTRNILRYCRANLLLLITSSADNNRLSLTLGSLT